MESGEDPGDSRKGASFVMNYAEIKKTDVANGQGVRVSLFVSGCTHHCRGCFNSETWDFAYGTEFTKETCQELLGFLEPEYIAGLTLLGGEPFEPSNQRALISFLKNVKETYPCKTIWCYTGYVLDRDLWRESRARCEVTDEMLSMIDVLVDGEFIKEQRNISLRFRGSQNQRIIDVPESIRQGSVCLLKGQN